MLVLGHGSIGRAVEARLEPFGATVTGVARRARAGVHTLSEAHALAGEADVVVVLLPLTRLRSGRVRAALDVTEPEPLPDGHPLFGCPGVLITPHVAGATERWLERALRLAGDQIRRFAAREPLANVRTEGY